MLIRESLELNTPHSPSRPDVNQAIEQPKTSDSLDSQSGTNLVDKTDANTSQGPRIWLSGEVVLEARDTPSQGQLFASWPRSRITSHIGTEPPDGYTGITYRILKAIRDVEC